MSVSLYFAAKTISHGLYVLGEITTEAIRHHRSVGHDVTTARLTALRSDLDRYRFITMDGFYEKDMPRVLDDLAQDLTSLQRKGLDLYDLLRPALPEGIDPKSKGSFAGLTPLPIGGWGIRVDGKLNVLPFLTGCAVSGYQTGMMRYFAANTNAREFMHDILTMYWRMHNRRELITDLAELTSLHKILKQTELLGMFPTVLIAAAFSKSVAAQSRRCVEIDYSDTVDPRYRLRRIR